MSEQPLAQGQPLVVMHEGDDVATALRDLQSGERVAFNVSARTGTILVRQPIPFGHKMALRDLQAGETVHKYGAVIGRTTAPIAAGEHVHVHNLSGIRGRGDLAAPGGKEQEHASEG